MRHDPVDLRSDTVTRPTPAMRQIMAEAEVGDDVFGDDPTVRELEEETARLLGQESALFVPSGTMANAVAVATHTERGDEAIVEETSHIALYEGGGPALLSGVQVWPFRGDRGMISSQALRGMIRPDDPHFARSRLLCLENTHNRAGGRVLPLDQVREVTGEARRLGLRTHLDGARLWNASVASGVAEREYGSLFDSVSVCYSKGLGAPVGSAVAGPREWIARARRCRKRFGGGMRQAGILAAGALYALRHHRERLREDHGHALRLAEGLQDPPGLGVRLTAVETNIVMVETAPEAPLAAQWTEALAARRVLAFPIAPRSIRLVTHLDVNDEDVEYVLLTLRALAREFASA